MNRYQKELLESYKIDIADYEQSVKSAEKELEEAKDYLNQQKLNYAESIIRLHEFLKGIKHD